jgi:hypothetical protein
VSASARPERRLNELERTATMSIAHASTWADGAAQAFLPGAQVAGRYRIVRFVARGGMGEVYEAEDLVLGERVALKTIRAGAGGAAGGERAVERFRREVQLARRVTHPNVCRIFDVGVHEGVSFLSMEFLAGETLSARLDRVGPLGEDDATRIVTGIAAGLEAAHHEGIVHRDLKCQNVMLVPTPRGERVVVTDFGLARLALGDDEQAQPDLSTGVGLVGSPAYMAPEQVRGGKIGPATDVYALGVVMFEMMTGRLPFVADTPLATAAMRLDQPAPSPTTLSPDTPARWVAAIARALERDPERRFPDAGALARAIAPAPPLAPPPRLWPALLIVAALTGGLVTAWALGGRDAGGPAPPAPPAPPRLRVLSYAVQKTGENRYQVDRPLFETWLADPEEHGKIGRIVPTMTDGQPSGVKLYAIQDGSLMARLGFKDGDTLQTIAEVRVTSREAFTDVARAITGRSHVLVNFMRGSEPHALEIVLVDPDKGQEP